MSQAAAEQRQLPMQVPDSVSPLGITQVKWEVLTKQIFPNAKDQEIIELAIKYCHARKLDVMKKPVHIVQIWDASQGKYVETIWPGINELLSTAHRTGLFAGKDAAVFGPEVEFEFKNTKFKAPETASVTVYRIVDGIKCGYTEEVYFIEKVALSKGLPNRMWKTSPKQQLAKCALAASLRVAFPEEIGGEPTAEEMEGQSINEGEEISRNEVVARAKIIAEEEAKKKGMPPITNVTPTNSQTLQAAADIHAESGDLETAKGLQKLADEAKLLSNKEIIALTKHAQQYGWSIKEMVKVICEKANVPDGDRSNWQKYLDENNHKELLDYFKNNPQAEETEIVDGE